MTDIHENPDAWDCRLEASLCSKCRRQFVPPRVHCVKCRGQTERIYLHGRGKLCTFTTLYITPEGFRPPLVFGICQLEGGPRVLGSFVDTSVKDSLHIGDPVEVMEKEGKYLLRIVPDGGSEEKSR